MFENFIITNHVVDRYLERIGSKNKDVMKRIKRDLHYTKVKRIVNCGNYRYVFTLNSKEFIFIYDRGKWILNTVIKRSRQNADKAIQDRLRSV
ncbi:hypothetical protein [Staphylococcus equorum]|uniref:Uncharacterized protein n=1 Tax=Staphylococcus equorum TaxID=246432 RepID=A0A9X4R2V6_9STAP|nr:hypothetical protein [Staphylococcus equorum]MDG0860309.1 hypothetical protein [Staphylococcus equorum]